MNIFFNLGREQAQMTGKRLKEITSHFENIKLHHSTMVRAIETADLIKEELSPSLDAHVDPMLCEGAPIPPEPPVGHWRPLMHVIIQLLKATFLI
jgi:serine/threonine-protein phosphatase PGAM5